MSARKPDNRFVRGLLLTAGASGRSDLLRRMSRAERVEQASRRALLLATSLALLSGAAVVYGAVLVPDLLLQPSGAANRVLHALAGVSVVLAVVCLGYWTWRRGHLERLRSESRRSVLVALGARGRGESRRGREELAMWVAGGTGQARGRANRRHYIQLLPVRRWT